MKNPLDDFAPKCPICGFRTALCYTIAQDAQSYWRCRRWPACVGAVEHRNTKQPKLDAPTDPKVA
jgi:hypothetical protein